MRTLRHLPWLGLALCVVAMVWVGVARGAVKRPAQRPDPVKTVLLRQAWAEAIAQSYFNEVPPCGVPVTSYALDLGDVAGIYVYVGRAYPDDCRIKIRWDIARYEPYEFCITYVHEYGHMLGLSHSTTGIMRAVVPDDFAPCYPMIPTFYPYRR